MCKRGGSHASGPTPSETDDDLHDYALTTLVTRNRVIGWRWPFFLR